MFSVLFPGVFHVKTEPQQKVQITLNLTMMQFAISKKVNMSKTKTTARAERRWTALKSLKEEQNEV